MTNKATNTGQQFYLASNTFTRAGYSFAGWNTTPATGYVQYVNGALYTMPDADVILYASWNAGNFTLSYNANGGSGTAPAGETVVMGNTFTVANNTFTPPANKKFKEWNTAADGSRTAYSPGTTAAVPPQNLTLYAIWCDYTPVERIDADLDALVWDAIKSGNSTENNVKAALNLPKIGANGTAIAWSALPTGIINTDTGAVTRQLVDQAVALTATVSYMGGTEKPKTFNLTVPAIPGKFEAEDAVIYKAKVFGDAQAVGLWEENRLGISTKREAATSNGTACPSRLWLKSATPAQTAERSAFTKMARIFKTLHSPLRVIGTAKGALAAYGFLWKLPAETA
ncbi:hypothetical protein Dtox_3753 [Desulfofarcimen acetoxidans DSM 771]|uniref:Atrophied bacterial Ig domain-containing protein n=2 Tax=Desulfofarcimen acetoxidans TaxID=58138 RepID=C8VWU7_DESAS|nr:hypothetical protein Dtox_3753 [Desulfofarcimen acetoxidans DSM 771]